MKTLTTAVSFISFNELRPVIANDPLGASSVRLRVASATLKAPIALSGLGPLALTVKAGTDFSVMAINGTAGADEDGVVGSGDQKTPAGSIAPLLEAGPGDAWLKYVCTAEASAEASAGAGPVDVSAAAEGSTTLAHYRHHTAETRLAAAVSSDLSVPRLAVVRDHVVGLEPNDAVSFETRGELSASVEVQWSDVFTSEIGSLARLLPAVGPLAIATTAGATCSVDVNIVDTFLVAFARTGDSGSLRIGIRKGNVRKADVTGGVSISARIANAKAIERAIDDVVAGLLGTAASRLDDLLQHLLTGATTAADEALASDIARRLQLAGTAAIAAAVDNLRERARGAVRQVVEAKVSAAFAYEYHRVRTDATVFEAAIAPEQLTSELHAALVRGDVATAFGAPASGLTVTRYLNERTTRVSKAWGFTLGVGKWQLFGRDRRRLDTVRRFDVLRQAEWRSYVGSGGYERTRLTWMVDFKADMRGFAPQPLVRDFDFGLHVAWIRDQQNFDRDDLTTALDFASLWSICPDAAQPWLRDRLLPLVGETAEWSFHVRIKDDALRPVLDAIGSMTPADFAGVAAAAMDPGGALRPVAARREAFSALWRAALLSEETFNPDTVERQADRLLPDPQLAWRERQTIRRGAFDPDTVAGIVSSNTGTFDDCRRLVRGSRRLADAISRAVADAGVVSAAYEDLSAFWGQSHEIRMLGALLVDVADRAGVRSGIDRSMAITSGPTTIAIASKDF